MTVPPDQFRDMSDTSEQFRHGDRAPREAEDDSEQFFLDDPFVFWFILIGMIICVLILLGCFAVALLGS